MRKVVKSTTIYDSETGEILQERASGYKKPVFVKFKDRYRFSKTYHLDMVEFENKAYYKYFYACICNLEMGTNRLIHHSKELYGGRSLTVMDLAVICNTTERTIYSFIDYCKEKKIIRRMDLDGEFFGYFVNPIYVFNGDKIQPILYLMFKGYGIEEYIKKGDVTLLNEYCSTFNLKEIVDEAYETYKPLPNSTPKGDIKN